MTPQQEKQLLQEIRSVRKEIKELKETIELSTNPEEYLDVKEACQFLRIGSSKLYKMIREDKLPCAKRISGHWRFKKSALLKWINQN